MAQFASKRDAEETMLTALRRLHPGAAVEGGFKGALARARLFPSA